VETAVDTRADATCVCTGGRLIAKTERAKIHRAKAPKTETFTRLEIDGIVFLSDVLNLDISVNATVAHL
jgi:ATP adenylyltransferase/5',5'''-P-1,P-4-tetraphosphate phosphorylase II